MTSNRGYIYVLANSAMPDLVKVGKTTRTPSERAAELSKVTGVPTPFIVVYEQLVDDCTAAEEFVHTVLEQQGFRESNNREFFRATPNEVIRIVMNLPNQVSSQLKFKTIQNEEMVDLQIAPWTELWEIAENYFHGRNFCIKSYNEALIIYKKAVKLGCLLAYYRIGNIYYEISKENQLNKKAKEEAFDWYKKEPAYVIKGFLACRSELKAIIQASIIQYSAKLKCRMTTSFNSQFQKVTDI